MIRIVWNNLIPPGFKQEDVIDKLISPAIFHNSELEDKIIQSSFYTRKKNGVDIVFPTDLKENKPSRTRFFSYQKESTAIAGRMISLLLLKTQHENVPYDMFTFPVRHVFKKQWQKILSDFDQNDITLFKEYIQLFWKEGAKPNDFDEQLKKWKSSSRISRQLNDVDVTFCYKNQEVKLEKLITAISFYDYSTSPYQDDSDNNALSEEDNIFFERLATMSVIACVWYIWEEAKNNSIYAEQIVRLAAMLFPTEEIKHFIPANIISDNSNVTMIDNEDSLLAEQTLKEAEAYLASHQYQLAGELFEKIFETYKYASDQIIGTALAHLVECCENNYRRPPRFTSIDDIKKEAINYKCVYISKKRQGIKARPERSKTATSGLYTVNCNNLISNIIAETKPSGWKETIASAPASTLSHIKTQRIILVSDDFNKNIQDSLDILDYIKCSIDKKETIISDWKNLELYLRCNENEATPLLDTALSYFTENTNQEQKNILDVIRIYLIDEAKLSADFLFAKHPHFYPLTFERNKSEEKKTISLVIVSNNPDHRYLKWLIKEGFWTLPRFDASVKTKITVISPYASEIGYSIITECPGLAGYSTIEGQIKGTPLMIDDIKFPSIDFKQTSFTDRSLNNELKATFSTGDHLYYIIDSESDLKGIQLGITIRELSIKKAIEDYRISIYSKKDYVIAIRCLNADYSALAQELIIPKEEEHANCWFNDYNFITWGSTYDLYSWDQLNGGIIESLAQCIHLQYSGSSYSKDDCQKHLASYFRRLYNHDSSFSAALSLPYRLYEANVIPRAWFIQNPDAWWNEQVRKELAENFRRKLFHNNDGKPDEQLLTRLAQYEHMRWCCYQLTRGWLPVDDNQQMIQYMIAGVTRHSLQIAKLHPCICSWKNLETLHKALSDAATRKIDYRDLKNFNIIKNDSMMEFQTAISPYLDKKFKKFFAPDEDYSYFQRIDNQNIEQTAEILETKWNPDKIYISDDNVK